jgi:sporulation protein YlmC with PRC-barrel domain
MTAVGDQAQRDVRAAYNKDQAFDVEPGMQVEDRDGQHLGTVEQVSGFGASRIGVAPSGFDGRISQAKSGTGYLTVTPGAGEPLIVPFGNILSVQDQRVIVQVQQRAAAPRPTVVPLPAVPWWRRLFSSGK